MSEDDWLLWLDSIDRISERVPVIDYNTIKRQAAAAFHLFRLGKIERAWKHRNEVDTAIGKVWKYLLDLDRW